LPSVKADQTAPVTPEATETSTTSASSSSPSIRPSAPAGRSHFYPALEALLPAEIGGVPVTRISFQGFADAGGDFCYVTCPGELTNLAAELGVEPTDLTIAEAIKQEAPGVLIMAFRAPEVSGSAVLAARVRAQRAEAVAVTVAGKRALWAFNSLIALSETVEYLYAPADVLYVVRHQAFGDPIGDVPPPTPPEVIEAFEALP
jgi:hypothetical protein